MALVELRNVSKIYRVGDEEIRALDDLTLDIDLGEFISIIGPSGSGKSTLMHILGCLDSPTKGTLTLDGMMIQNASPSQLALVRNQKIGFVFQSFNLLPRTSALKNVMLPMAYAGISADIREQKAIELLKLVDLSDRTNHLSNQLSGGQQQRVAIARALSMDPKIILADEPTGNIASDQAEGIMKIFEKLNKDGRTIVMITHEPDIAAHAKRIIVIRDGEITEDHKNKK